MSSSSLVIKQGKALVNGQAEGEVLATTSPLSFWGGFNPATGEIIDRHHPLSNANASGKVFVLPSGRGSCTGSGILLEAIYSGHAPAAILLREMDEIISLGAIAADEFLQKSLPIIVLNSEDFEDALKAKFAFIYKDGKVVLQT